MGCSSWRAPRLLPVDIRGFYDGDPRRQESEEVLYGDGWTSAGDAHATYRLTWVADTGELVVVREPHPGGLLARYLDELRLDQADVDELRVEVLAEGLAEADVDRRLEGWQEAEARDDSLSWLREQLTPR